MAPGTGSALERPARKVTFSLPVHLRGSVGPALAHAPVPAPASTPAQTPRAAEVAAPATPKTPTQQRQVCA